MITLSDLKNTNLEEITLLNCLVKKVYRTINKNNSESSEKKTNFVVVIQLVVVTVVFGRVADKLKYLQQESFFHLDIRLFKLYRHRLEQLVPLFINNAEKLFCLKPII